MLVTVHGGIDGQTLKILDLLGQTVHQRRQFAKGQRMRAQRINQAVGLYHRVVRQSLNGTVIGGIHHHLNAKIVVQRVNQLHRHFGVERTAALAQLFWFLVQIRVGIQLEQRRFDLHHLLGASAFAVGIRQFVFQHGAGLPEIAVIRARNGAQRAQ